MEKYNASGNCYRYDIARDQWQEIAKLNSKRLSHGSCQLGEHLYVFCGHTTLSSCNTVEKLKIDADPNIQKKNQWELIPKANLVALPKLYEIFTIALNADEILILKRYNFKNEVYLFDTRTDTCSAVTTEGAC